MTFLEAKVSIKRRYYRSINLERDIDNVDAVTGYVLTAKASECLKRMIDGLSAVRGNRAWTLTGTYGSGKSAFAQFLLSLLGPVTSAARAKSDNIVSVKKLGRAICNSVAAVQQDKGFVRCVATCRSESISSAVVRAIRNGAERYFGTKIAKQRFYSLLANIEEGIDKGKLVSDTDILGLMSQLAIAAKAPVLLLLDELGKCLEFSARKRSGDLFLLQQLAELPFSDDDPRIFVVGLLHQSFADYADTLSPSARAEWHKVQGRFEDISFVDSSTEMLSLLCDAVQLNDKSLSKRLQSYESLWSDAIRGQISHTILPESINADLYPLHPLAACLLPQLCSRLGQNERSLFTLLTSEEPDSFTQFLRETSIGQSSLPTYKLCNLFDYFCESGIRSHSTRAMGIRWSEIEERIRNQSSLGQDEQKLLKTIGLFNLVSTGGNFRASRKLILLSMVDQPADSETNNWEELLNRLLERKLVVYRTHLDEFRLWEGTDFEIDTSLQHYRSLVSRDFASVLSRLQKLSPVIAQRHSYQTGTMRLFDQVYLQDENALTALQTAQENDGLIVYWLGTQLPKELPESTADGKPIVFLSNHDISGLHAATIEVSALQALFDESAELQVDKVARKEVRTRLLHAKLVWEETFPRYFGFSEHGTTCHRGSSKVKLRNYRSFNSLLSDICDEIYFRAPVLWNELVNRRELTSQGAKARNELLSAMLSSANIEDLALSGHGPEVSMYKSVLSSSGIHEKRSKNFCFGYPSQESFQPVWQALDLYVETAGEEQKSVREIYSKLQAAPFGIKSGVIPIILAAYFVANEEKLSLYKEGTFIGSIGPEHFELLVKDPSRFAVKNLVTSNTYSGLFKRYLKVTRKEMSSPGTSPGKTGILSVVRPLVSFIKKLPVYSQQARELISAETLRVKQSLLEAREPDTLLFVELPNALGFSDLRDSHCSTSELDRFCDALVLSLRELNSVYDLLIEKCKSIIIQEFGIATDINWMSSILNRLRTIAPSLRNSEFSQLAFQFLDKHDETIDESEFVRRFAMVVADKPPESWTDRDFQRFGTNARTYVGTLRNFEALHSEMITCKSDKYELSRISLTLQDGSQQNRVVRLDKQLTIDADRIVEEFLNERLKDKDELVEAVIARLTQKLLQLSNSAKSLSR